MREILEKSFFRGLFNRHNPDSEKNIFIFSLPRSGSTWLQELIWTQPGFKYANEPLNLKGEWLCEKSGINGFEELYNSSSKDKVIKYFQGFVNGKNHFLDPNPLRKYYRPFTNRIVFKIIHGGELFINDIADRCNGQIVYLLRHPIPVALSRKQLPRMDQLCSDDILDHFSDDIKQYAQAMNRDGDPFERRILAWCIQNKLAFLQNRENWLILTYEQLVMNPDPAIRELCQKCSLPKPERIKKQLNIPSAVSVQSMDKDVEAIQSRNDNRSYLVNKWKDQCSVSQIDSSQRICEEMNFTVYDSSSGMPGKEWLHV